jgi:hypothetical protein
MWYETSWERRATVPGLRNDSLHLAVSEDGISWRKPGLATLAVDGADTNLCVWEDGTPVDGARTVFFDEDDPDPSRRYKLMRYLPNYHLAYSADGVRWRPAQAAPVWTNGAGDGLEETNSFMKDPVTGRYRGYMRVWRRQQTIRKLALGESDDLCNWTGPHIIWEATPHYGLGSQIYGMDVCVEQGCYWGFPWVFYTDEPLAPELRQTMRIKLAHSRDGRDWQALAPETDMIPMGARGEGFDWGMMLSGRIHQGASENRFYYDGCNGLHDGATTLRAVGLATWEPGRLVGLQAETSGVLLTRRFRFRGDSLHINARTHAGGSVRAELVDDRGNRIAAHGADRHDAFTGDALDHRLTWAGEGDLSALLGRSVMLRLELADAEVFGFRQGGSPETFAVELTAAPVAVGRCRAAPVIDGVLDEDCWQDFTRSGVLADFVGFERIEPAAVQTRALLTCDAERLYVAVECEEPLSDELPVDRAPGGVCYNAEECLELRLTTPADVDGQYVQQFMITVTGALEHNRFSKEAGGTEGGLQSDWSASVRTVPGRWVAEIAIPFSALRTAPPQACERWACNLIRYRHLGAGETSCWVCMLGSVHSTDRMGELVFDGG